ncbi:hypothetical protein FACS189450_08700 [Spirochaetia bacterium]|nr:hypothetical protein FACS189450_08700 [Spirochaetia bacterium]
MKNLLKQGERLVTAALITTILVTAFIITGCAQVTDVLPKTGSTGGGRTVVRIADNNARTLMPAMIGEADVSKYEVAITKGEETVTWTADDAAKKAELTGGGHSFDLEDGTWTLTIDAYRLYDLDGEGGNPAAEYKAASGEASLTVTAAGANTVSVTLNEIARTDWGTQKGIFSWNLTLPSGVTVKTAKLGTINLTGTSGSIEANAGIYDLTLILTQTATGLTAGVYETAYVFPGLETPAVFDFTPTAGITFGNNIPVSGTLAAVTGAGVSPAGSDFTITAYSDAACTTAISIAPVTVGADWTWTVWVPALPSQTAYFKASSSIWSFLSGGVSEAVTLGPEVKTGVVVPVPAIGTGKITFTFTGPADENISVGTITPISWASNGSLTLTVATVYSSYAWYVDGILVSGVTGNTLTINARDYEKKQHTVTVGVTKADGIPYTKVVTFTVGS